MWMLAPGAGAVAPSPALPASSTASEGFLHCGPAGAGHFVKMIHNGIEYGLMQAYAEGFDIMRHAASESLPPEQRFDLNLGEIAEVWRRGSVVSSWLLDLAAIALNRGGDRRERAGRRPDHGVVRAIPIAPGPHLRREAALRASRAIRRSCRAPTLIPASS